MTETGRILEIRGNCIIIAPDKSAACFGCMKAECKSGGGRISAENPGALPLRIGQMVEVETPGAGLMVQALAAFLPPILGFMAGFALVRLVFPKAGEGAAAFTGIIVLFAAAFVVYKLRKKSPVHSEFTIARIIE